MAKSLATKFRKSIDGLAYWAERNDVIVARIEIHYNWYDHSNYYIVNGHQYNYLKDAKQYVRENM